MCCNLSKATQLINGTHALAWGTLPPVSHAPSAADRPLDLVKAK